jgi:hypothetical protein
MQRAGSGVGSGFFVVVGLGVGVLVAGNDQSAQLDLVMMASKCGPPLSVQVVEETQEAPDGLYGRTLVRAGKLGSA